MPVAQVALHVVRILGYFRGGLFQMTNVKNTKNPLKQGGAVPVELYGISNLEEIGFELLFGLGVKWNRFAIFFTLKNFQSSGFPI